MGELTGASPDKPYKDRLNFLKNNGIALWDVCKSAYRVGSLDSNIQSPLPNDFGSFFKKHKRIELICFNGQPAEKLFRRFSLTGLPAVRHIILPSTSPAHAKMTYKKKLFLWSKALREFVG